MATQSKRRGPIPAAHETGGSVQYEGHHQRPMGVGKTTVGKAVADKVPGTAFIDRNRCLDVHPFVGNRETKAMNEEQLERRICAAICQSDGLKAKEIARLLNLDRNTVNHILYASPLLRELCYQDNAYEWHGSIRQARPHAGLFEFSGFYAMVFEFLRLTEDEWMDRLLEGCERIGRSLNNTRGLLHSFRDCREQMVRLFADLRDMMGDTCLDWEIAFEFRLKRARYVRIYADVLVITKDKVFSLEFKMKDTVDPEEVAQAAKYCPYLEIVFGPGYEVIPALVLSAGKEMFDFAPIGGSDSILPVCSGDMLFNVFDEYLGFLSGEGSR